MEKKNIITDGKTYRITVLTNRLIRFEYSKDAIFEDRKTQVVVNRDFPPAAFRVEEREQELKIMTDRVWVTYDKKRFSKNGLMIQPVGLNARGIHAWRFGETDGNLKGTARTLDGVDGETELDCGVISRTGSAVLDDSRSLVMTEGFVEPRRGGVTDFYYFGYGHDYLDALHDFYYLCGRTPMLPRFALGNWWSRYWNYSQESYLELMEAFEQDGIPFCVAILDMDWHLVDIDPKYGTGWTGFTWNRELFPEPKTFLDKLHERGMAVSLNLHPADGIRAFEVPYQRLAGHMGINPATEETVGFDCADPHFLKCYFEDVLHPIEEEGVDFWWLDWQQGNNTRLEGLDPLWILNKYHYEDNGKAGKRALAFSRYAGPGSHRFPIGFSGDTIVSWDSLDFQPYFTATAANIGFGWWSHDIGGHFEGDFDEELEVRWYQLGVFSPINRLHSSNVIFFGKEPWNFGMEAHAVMKRFLRLRHQLIPYLYTMNYRAHSENMPLILPMYYFHPEEQEAYQVKNEYYFGSEMIVAPITQPGIKCLKMGKVTVWLPEGIYYDFFTQVKYRGGRMITMYRSCDSIPVLVKAGGIIPMTEEIQGRDFLQNPREIELQVYGGEDGRFTLYEDDNTTNAYRDGRYVKTRITWQDETQQALFETQGDEGLIPKERAYRIHLINREQNDIEGLVYRLLWRCEMPFAKKEAVYRKVQLAVDKADLLSDLYAMELNPDIYGALCEIVTAY